MTLLRAPDMRLAKKYFLNLVCAHAMFDFNFSNEPIFPNDLM